MAKNQCVQYTNYKVNTVIHLGDDYSIQDMTWDTLNGDDDWNSSHLSNLIRKIQITIKSFMDPNIYLPTLNWQKLAWDFEPRNKLSSKRMNYLPQTEINKQEDYSKVGYLASRKSLRVRAAFWPPISSASFAMGRTASSAKLLQPSIIAL